MISTVDQFKYSNRTFMQYTNLLQLYNTQMQLKIGNLAVTSYRTHIVNRESEINIMQMQIGVFYALSTVSLMLGYILVHIVPTHPLCVYMNTQYLCLTCFC